MSAFSSFFSDLWSFANLSSAFSYITGENPFNILYEKRLMVHADIAFQKSFTLSPPLRLFALFHLLL
jgi:hypothetical protein